MSEPSTLLADAEVECCETGEGRWSVRRHGQHLGAIARRRTGLYAFTTRLTYGSLEEAALGIAHHHDGRIERTAEWLGIFTANAGWHLETVMALVRASYEATERERSR